MPEWIWSVLFLAGVLLTFQVFEIVYRSILEAQADRIGPAWHAHRWALPPLDATPRRLVEERTHNMPELWGVGNLSPNAPLTLTPSTERIVQAQRGSLAWLISQAQSEIEHSLAPLIQASLAQYYAQWWLELHPMPVECAAAEADDGPIPSGAPTVAIPPFLVSTTEWRVSQEDHEFLWSHVRDDRPRMDAWLWAQQRQCEPLGPGRAIPVQRLEDVQWFTNALLNPYVEGDNTARVEAVLRETGGHDLTGMSSAEVDALLDKLLLPEEDPS